jgi:hypothetical protein
LALRSAGAGRAGSCPTPPRSAWQAPPSPDRGVRACPTGWWGVPTNALGRAASGASEAGYGVPQCGSRTASLRWAVGGGAAPTGAHGGHRQIRVHRESRAHLLRRKPLLVRAHLQCVRVRVRGQYPECDWQYPFLRFSVPLMRLAVPLLRGCALASVRSRRGPGSCSRRPSQS